MPGPPWMTKNCSQRTVPRVPSSSKVQPGVPRQGGRKSTEGGAWVAQVGSFLSPSPLLHGLASPSVTWERQPWPTHSQGVPQAKRKAWLPCGLSWL